jgi:fructose-bisphosphate aldolase class II
VRIPLAIQAGSGFSDEQFHKLIQCGVAKIDCDSALAEAASEQLRAQARGTGRAGYHGVVAGVRDAVQTAAELCMQRWGAAGRAAEVLVQCRTWQSVQHVIVYNIEHADDAAVESMMARGREVLAQIPGVRRVVAGWAVTDRPKYRYCWLVEFVHENVIDVYRDHPLHLQFANELFRPVAGDRITIDFSAARPVSTTAIERSQEMRARA